LILLLTGFYFSLIHVDEVEDFQDDYEDFKDEISKIATRIRYWEPHNSKKPLPINTDKFFIWQPWSAGTSHLQ
jgi:hypothetical protein